jgi:hypothetical protein
VRRQITALSCCVMVLYTCGDTARAMELMRQALSASAHRSDCIPARCTMLINLSLMLMQDANDFVEAAQCCADAAALALQSPGLEERHANAKTRMAYVQVKHAQALAQSQQAPLAMPAQGLRLDPQQAQQHEQQQAQQHAAAQALQAVDASAWPTLSYVQRNTLVFQVFVQAWLGRWPEARRSAAAALRLGRQAGSGRIARAGGFEALAEFYLCKGDLPRSIRYEQRIVVASRAGGDAGEVGRSQRRLAGLHAKLGDFASALTFHKTQRLQLNEQQVQASLLRCRLAAVERQTDRRRYQATEALAHTQRLAVIGRLIGQTHHALHAPILRVRQLCITALQVTDGLLPLLQELNQSIDIAANLVSQLKLFSYRATPQPMALSLRESLQNAWRELAPHVATREVLMHVAAGAKVQAWADAQRLGILLKVLLIELTQTPGVQHIHAGLEDPSQSDQNTVTLHIAARGAVADVATPSGVATAQAWTSLGVTLCMEIAEEMGGSLRVWRRSPAAPHSLDCCLRLPAANEQGQTLPTLLP